MTDTQARQSTGSFEVRFSGPGARWLRLLGHRGLAPLALLLLALALYLPGLVSAPPLGIGETQIGEPQIGETQIVETARHMLTSGDLVDTRLRDGSERIVPPGLPLLQALSAAASGQGAEAPLWIFRLPSLAGAVLAVLLGYWCARAFVAPPPALLAGALTAAALPLGAAARLGEPDALLLAAILAMQGALARIWLSRTPGASSPGSLAARGLAAIFWVGLGSSVLMAGLSGPVVAGLSVLALCLAARNVRWLARLLPLPGLAILALIVLPWTLASALRGEGGILSGGSMELFAGILSGAGIGSSLGARGFGAPPLAHLLFSLVAMWPLPAFLLLGLPMLLRSTRSPQVVFFLCCLVPLWLLIELLPAKAPQQALLLVPALAGLAALLLSRGDEGAAPHRPGRILRYAAAGLFAVPLVALVAANLVAGPLTGSWPSPPGAVIALLALVPGVSALRRLARGEAAAALMPALGAGILLAAAVWAFTLPSVAASLAPASAPAAVAAEPVVSQPDVPETGVPETDSSETDSSETGVSEPAASGTAQ
ncbi:ArnT family glycosyltransferase [Stappia indica]|uniref:Glycosyltransferase family 39 protein n=1 Tax=Stappia indica TaxID=538381 RepID=A0A857C3T4_9HYPH|nr:glycosyltransferase family 39 protein [Stappia indica]QGZ33495.1 glycosyltransferase family 39 protein [Stappia indica]